LIVWWGFRRLHEMKDEPAENVKFVYVLQAQL